MMHVPDALIDTSRPRMYVLLATLLSVTLLPTAVGQPDEGVMEVAERDADERAVRINLDFVNAELSRLIRFLSEETDLTIIATEEDIQNKKLSMVNLRDVTIDEALEKIKSGLMQFGLTTIQTDRTLIITTIQKAVKMKVPVSTGADPESIPDSDQVITHVIPLQYLQAAELAGSFKELVSEAGVLFGDKDSNTLVITDVASNIRRIATILSSMDDKPTIPYKIKVISLVNGDAEQIARALRELFSDETQSGYGGGRGGPGPDEMHKMMERAAGGGLDVGRGKILITSSVDSNQIIVRASEENIAIVETLVGQMDTAPALQMEFRVFRLRYANSEDVVEDLEDILEGQSQGGDQWRPWWAREQGGASDIIQGIIGEVRIAADERLNGIIIGTDPRNYTVIETLIGQIDQEDQPGEEIEIFFLKNADATEVVNDITTLIQGADDDEWTPWWARGPETEESTTMGFGLRGEVNLTADERLNAVIAATSAANLVVLRDLIGRLDVSMPEQEWGTRIYRLEYADAENVTDILNSVYQGSGQSGGGFFSFLPTIRQSRSQGSLAGNVVAEAYPTINAIIVSTSTSRNFDMIEEFIAQLDVATPKDQREVTRVIPLEYATADSLQGLLDDLWEGEDQGFSFGRLISRGFRPEQNDINSLRGKVRVFADPDTNSLVVTTRARYIDDLKLIIDQLDTIRGQVWIDITILEVTLDDSTKMGLELALTEKRLFGVDAFGKGATPGKNPLTGEFASELNLAQEITGFSISLATNEYMAFLHTLMRRNQVRTLSRVPLFVRDNQEAEFSSGRDIPYLQSAQSSSLIEGQLFNFDFLQDIGVTVRITPHIARGRTSKSGKRTIGLQIDEIAVSNFIEFTNFNAPLTEDSHISTYIDAEDGQQIVIGGLKKHKRQEIEEKVPILGDLPLIGALFRRTEEVTQETEIVMVITPHIVSISEPAYRERIDELQRERFGSDAPDALLPPPSKTADDAATTTPE